eukprot:6217156-Heterocapsa_arctica.AAC.1
MHYRLDHVDRCVCQRESEHTSTTQLRHGWQWHVACVQLEVPPNHDSPLAASVQDGAEEPAAGLGLSIDKGPPR